MTKFPKYPQEASLPEVRWFLWSEYLRMFVTMNGGTLKGPYTFVNMKAFANRIEKELKEIQIWADKYYFTVEDVVDES